MQGKNIRYINTILTLDRKERVSFSIWNNEDINDFLREEELHYGLKLINQNPISYIYIEYTNIIWIYKLYYGTYKKKYKPLQDDDERWNWIKKEIESDLKMIGLEELLENVIISLKRKEYFEYKNKNDKQFKKYCIIES